jgi:hypothetical protein
VESSYASWFLNLDLDLDLNLNLDLDLGLRDGVLPRGLNHARSATAGIGSTNCDGHGSGSLD